MKVYRGSKSFPASIKNPAVALGNFDGVHRAHQAMFKVAKRLAKKNRGHSVVYTFEPHPVKVLSPASAPPMINTLEQKLELIEEQKIDVVVVEPFNLRFAHMGARAWFDRIILKNLHATAIVAGYDFTFGTHRSGTIEFLQNFCNAQQIQCEILEAQLQGEMLISSTQIRQFVTRGEMSQAERLLGRPFFLDGTVIQGMGRGATLGIRTANLKVENDLLPARGVYACWARSGKRKYRSVVNIGMNPTFGGQALSIEAHLLEFKKDIYGEKLRLYFKAKIRDERTFASPKELIDQIHRDVKAGKKILDR